MFDEEWKKETLVDGDGHSYPEIGRKAEDASEQNCQVTEANRRGNSAKGIQYGIVARLARLTI